MKKERCGVRIGLLAALVGGASLQGASITWNNSQGTMRWNTSESNFTGAAFASGDAVAFGSAGAGSVYIVEAGSVPVAVAPASVSIANATYTFSGGDLASGSLAKSGSGTVTFSGYTNSLGFAGGTTIAGGSSAPLVFEPAAPGSFSFGSGAITLNGGCFFLGGLTNETALANDFTVTSGGGTLLWNGTGAARTLSGDITLNGTLTLGNAHPYKPGRPLKLTGTLFLNGGDRTLSCWSEPSLATVPQVLGHVDGGNVRSFSLGPNWTGRALLIGGAGGWAISNLYAGVEQVWVEPVTDATDFFSGVRTNRGQVIVQPGESAPGVLHLRGGSIHLGDFLETGRARVNLDLSAGRTLTSLGGVIAPAGYRNGAWLTPSAGALSGPVTVSSGGVMRVMLYGSPGMLTASLKLTNAVMTLLGGSVLEVGTGLGDWNQQVRLGLQALDPGDGLRVGDGSAATPETVTFRGSCNVAYSAGVPKRGFIVQVDGDQVADDGNVVLRYETPTNSPLLPATALSGSWTYDGNDRFIVGWSDRTNSRIAYAFRGGSAGTEFVPQLASIDALGPVTGTVFTATAPVRILGGRTVGFYASDAAMDRAGLGDVVFDAGGSLSFRTNGTVLVSNVTFRAGSALAVAPVGVSTNAAGLLKAAGVLTFEAGTVVRLENPGKLVPAGGGWVVAEAASIAGLPAGEGCRVAILPGNPQRLAVTPLANGTVLMVR